MIDANDDYTNLIYVSFKTMPCSLTFFFLYNPNRYVSEMAGLTALQDTSQALSLKVMACEERASQAEADLRIERGYRMEVQESETEKIEQINNLQYSMKQLQEDARKHERVKQELDKLKKQWSEAQTTLEELGIQLSVSKLQVSELQEKVNFKESNKNSNNDAGTWTPDSMSSKCRGCNREFSLTKRKVYEQIVC